MDNTNFLNLGSGHIDFCINTNFLTLKVLTFSILRIKFLTVLEYYFSEFLFRSLPTIHIV